MSLQPPPQSTSLQLDVEDVGGERDMTLPAPPAMWSPAPQTSLAHLAAACATLSTRYSGSRAGNERWGTHEATGGVAAEEDAAAAGGPGSRGAGGIAFAFAEPPAAPPSARASRWAASGALAWPSKHALPMLPPPPHLRGTAIGTTPARHLSGNDA